MDRHIEEAYQNCKIYLNKPADADCAIGLLQDMCSSCEYFCGVEEHDYSQCREKSCFKLFLGYEYAEWCETWR